jgi:hypothetical protein
MDDGLEDRLLVQKALPSNTNVCCWQIRTFIVDEQAIQKLSLM